MSQMEDCVPDAFKVRAGRPGRLGQKISLRRCIAAVCAAITHHRKTAPLAKTHNGSTEIIRASSSGRQLAALCNDLMI